MRSKFKVGDIVVGNEKASEAYLITAKGVKLKVLEVLEVVEGDDSIKVGLYPGQDHVETPGVPWWWVDSGCFDLYQSEQTIEELVEENLSLMKQIKSLEARLKKKRNFFRQNASDITLRVEGALHE